VLLLMEKHPLYALLGSVCLARHLGNWQAEFASACSMAAAQS